MRISVSSNFTQTGLNIITEESKRLGLSRSCYLESLTVVKHWENGNGLSANDLETLRLEFLMNTASTLTLDFRNQFLHLSPSARFALIAFFCGMNLISGVSIHSQKQANIRKKDELVCYIGVGIIGREQKLVIDYVESFSNPKFILGPSNQPKDEYIFISCMQQFIQRRILYPHFQQLCTLLGIPINTEIIQIHYTELEKLLSAFELI
jgi:hypothetical protein